jgi:hypothetical protein
MLPETMRRVPTSSLRDCWSMCDVRGVRSHVMDIGASGMGMTEYESLAEDVLLLALDNTRGTSRLKEKQLRSALASATVMDLLLGGHIAAMDGQAVVVNRGPARDPVCDHALSCIGNAKTRTPLAQCGDLIAAAMPDIAHRLRNQLVERGILQRQSHPRLGLLPGEERFPERDGRLEHDVRSRLRSVALHGTQPDPRTAVLAALVAGYHLDDALFSDEERPLGCAQLRDLALSMHQRPPGGVSATASGFAANAQTAGIANVNGNAFVDFMTDEGIGAVFEFIFDLLPTLIGGLFEILDAF